MDEDSDTGDHELSSRSCFERIHIVFATSGDATEASPTSLRVETDTCDDHERVLCIIVAGRRERLHTAQGARGKEVSGFVALRCRRRWVTLLAVWSGGPDI